MPDLDLTPEQARESLTKLIPADVKVTFAFVPWSQSRHASKDVKLDKLNLNWKVTFTRGQQTFATDYMQGIAHIPGYTHKTRMCVDDFNALKYTCETGTVGAYPRKKIPSPDVVDVLSCLCRDADVLNYGSFEDWASDFGYNTDSRDAENIYKASMEIALKLKVMLSVEMLTKMQQVSNQM